MLFISERFYLTLNQFLIVKVVNAHGLTYLIHRLGGSLASLLRTLLQDVIDFRDILLQLVTALAHRLQELVQYLVQELLALHVAQTATTVVVLQLVQVLVLRPVQEYRAKCSGFEKASK